MRTVGLSLGLALLCLLHVEAEDLGAAELDKSKVAGKWYITAMASDSPSYLEKKDQLKMAMANIEVLENGDLKLSFAIPTPERCMKVESIYNRTSNSSVYHSTDRGNKTAQLVNTDGRTYMIIFATRETDGKIFATTEKDRKILRMLRLYSRTQWVSPRIIKLFKTFAKMKGFTDNTIWILPRQEECSLDEP